MPDRIDLDALERAAKAATPGPWRCGVGDVRDSNKRLVAHVMSTRGDFEDEGPNAEYIAAADPQTVLALVEAVRAAQMVDALEAPYNDPLRLPQYMAEAIHARDALRSALAKFGKEN